MVPKQGSTFLIIFSLQIQIIFCNLIPRKMILKFLLLLFLCVIFPSIKKISADDAYCNYAEKLHNINEYSIREYGCELGFYGYINRVSELNGDHKDGNDDDVKILTISSSFSYHMETFSPTFCQKFKNLVAIDMTKAKIKKIDENSIHNCPNLKILSFSENEFENIKGNLFQQNKKLEHLYISFNDLKTLPENVFSSQGELRTLDLQFNCIETFPDRTLGRLKKLRELNLGGNCIVNLRNNWFRSLKSLEILNLSFNTIKELPKDVFKYLGHLKKLELSNNKLRTIHSNAFGNHKRFTFLDLSKNNINAVDKGIIGKTAISELHFMYNLCGHFEIIDKAKITRKLDECFENYKNKPGDLDIPTEEINSNPPTTTSTTTIRVQTPPSKYIEPPLLPNTVNEVNYIY